jgi:hypothetical protein
VLDASILDFSGVCLDVEGLGTERRSLRLSLLKLFPPLTVHASKVNLVGSLLLPQFAEHWVVQLISESEYEKLPKKTPTASTMLDLQIYSFHDPSRATSEAVCFICPAFKKLGSGAQKPKEKVIRAKSELDVFKSSSIVKLREHASTNTHVAAATWFLTSTKSSTKKNILTQSPMNTICNYFSSGSNNDTEAMNSNDSKN